MKVINDIKDQRMRNNRLHRRTTAIHQRVGTPFDGWGIEIGMENPSLYKTKILLLKTHNQMTTRKEQKIP